MKATTVLVLVFFAVNGVDCLKKQQFSKAEKLKLAKKYLDQWSQKDNWIDPHDMFASPPSPVPKTEERIAQVESSSPEEETFQQPALDLGISSSNSNNDSGHKNFSSSGDEAISERITRNATGEASVTPDESHREERKSERRLRKSMGHVEVGANPVEDAFSVLKGSTCMASDYVFLSRWLRRFVKKMKDMSSTATLVTFNVTDAQLTNIEAILAKPQPSMIDVETVLLDVLSGATYFAENSETFFSQFDHFLKEDITKFFIVMSLILILVIFICNFIPYPKYTVLVGSVVFSVGSQWMQMYKEAIAEKASVLAQTDYPTACRQADMGILESIRIYFKSAPSSTCSDYHKAIMVDPLWDVSLTKAISLSFSKFVFAPLEAVGVSLNVFIKMTLKNLSYFESFAILIVICYIVRTFFKYYYMNRQAPVSHNSNAGLPSPLHPAIDEKPLSPATRLPPPAILCKEDPIPVKKHEFATQIDCFDKEVAEEKSPAAADEKTCPVPCMNFDESESQTCATAKKSVQEIEKPIDDSELLQGRHDCPLAAELEEDCQVSEVLDKQIETGEKNKLCSYDDDNAKVDSESCDKEEAKS